jgi:mono/diheme cytochrome c family protein
MPSSKSDSKKEGVLIYIVLALVAASALALAACGTGSGATEAPGSSDGQGFERPQPPPEYAGMSNPHADDAAAIAAGEMLYQTNCASCHGEKGRGDGPAAAALDPKPQDLAANQPHLSDAYMVWRISEGGLMQPFNSSMPAWKSIFSQDEIWQMISYIRTLGT